MFSLVSMLIRMRMFVFFGMTSLLWLLWVLILFGELRLDLTFFNLLF